MNSFNMIIFEAKTPLELNDLENYSRTVNDYKQNKFEISLLALTTLLY